MLAISAGMMAVPAKRGIWRTVKLANGTEVKVELRGDEHASFWQAEDGSCFVEDYQNKVFKQVAMSEIREIASDRREKTKMLKSKSSKQKAENKKVAFTGEKRGVLILVNFTDKKFAAAHTRELYDKICNETNFSNSMGFKSSVKDYFSAQSNGQFLPAFDVVGPVELTGTVAYYGENNAYTNDIRRGKMIGEACLLANESVDFSKYDWDGDGEVEQVFVVYAGRGEANGGTAETIWPHESQLAYSDYGRKLLLDGVYINTYACSSEATQKRSGLPGDRIEGIGTICHEFSHCLGLPDMYDTEYSGNFGMNEWSLMDQGAYNGSGFTPTGYTSYERMASGWMQPITLDKPTTVKNMKPLSEGGMAFVVYNDNNNNEYYLLENRYKSGTDVSLPGEGLLVLHIDYNKIVWNQNIVNTFVSNIYYSNDHQRCTIFHADNSDGTTSNDLAGDPYPLMGKDASGNTVVMNNELSDTSLPATTLFNKNIDGTKLMGKAVTNIVRHDDGTISFDFMGGSETNIISGIDSPINDNTTVKANNRIYNLNGTCLGSDINKLPKGLYIMNGKKIVK